MRTVLSLLGTMMACGGGPKATPANDRPVPGFQAADSSAPKAGISTALPKGAPLSGTFFPGRLKLEPWLEQWRARVPEFARRLEKALGLARLLHGEGIASLGIDSARPVRFAVYPLSHTQRATVRSLRTRQEEVRGGHASKGTLRTALRELLGNGAVSARVVIPYSDAGAIHRTLEGALQNGPWQKVDQGDYGMPGVRLSVGASDQDLVIDVTLDPRRDTPARVREAEGATEAEARGDKALHMEFDPGALSQVGYLWGLGKVSQALSEDLVDEAHADEIAHEGAHEAAQSFALVSKNDRALYERVEIAVDVTESLATFAVRTKPGPALVLPEAVWALGPSLEGGRDASFQMSTALREAWGDSLGDGLRDFGHYNRSLREAGVVGYLLGLPAIPFAVATKATRKSHLPPRIRWERTGQSVGTPKGVTMAWGLFGSATTRAEAECALADRVPCGEKNRLSWTKPRRFGPSEYRLLAQGGRFFLMVEPHSSPGAMRVVEAGPFTAAATGQAVPFPGESPLASLVEKVEFTVGRRGEDPFWEVVVKR